MSNTPAIPVLDRSHTADSRPPRRHCTDAMTPHSSRATCSNQQQRRFLLAPRDGSTVEDSPLDRPKATHQSKGQNPRVSAATFGFARRLKAQRKGDFHSLPSTSIPVSSSSVGTIISGPPTKRLKSKGPLLSRICGPGATLAHPHPCEDYAIVGDLNPGLFFDDKENVRNHAASGRAPQPPASEVGHGVEGGAAVCPPACNGTERAENAKRKELLLMQADEFLDDLLTEYVPSEVTLKSIAGPGCMFSIYLPEISANPLF